MQGEWGSSFQSCNAEPALLQSPSAHSQKPAVSVPGNSRLRGLVRSLLSTT